jgi:hypothetical protein
LLALTLIRGLFYAAVVPPWQGPDETGHFEYAWLIANLGRLPGQEDVSPAFEQELLASLYEWRYGELIGHPLPEGLPARLDELPTDNFARRSRTILRERFSLAYLWQALFLLPLRSHDLSTQLFAARISSVLLALGIVLLAFAILSELNRPRSYLICAMTAVVVFLPQHTFVNSMVGDGVLAELMVCLVLFCWARLFRRGMTIWLLVGIILGTLGGIWSKTTAMFLIPLNTILALWWFFRQPRRTGSWRTVAFLVGGLAFLAVALWLWNRFWLPPGSQAISIPWESLSGESVLWEDMRGMSFGEALLLSYDSFWAYFGWMAVPVSDRWYGAILLATLGAAVGWGLWSRDRATGRAGRYGFDAWAVIMMAGALVLAVAIFVWIALLSRATGYYQFQGRYLFPVVVPFAFLLVGGWVNITPSRTRGVLVWAGLVFLTVFDAWAVMRYVVPYFYFG